MFHFEYALVTVSAYRVLFKNNFDRNGQNYTVNNFLGVQYGEIMFRNLVFEVILPDKGRRPRSCQITKSIRSINLFLGY